MKKSFTVWLPLLLLILLSNVLLPINQGAAAGSDYWPITGWHTSTPEEQGIDSRKLCDMLNLIKATNMNIHSILIIRHGYLVLESYIAPYDRDTIHNLKSVSKSFLSALAGIALREKLLTNLDQKVADILPEYFASIDDPRKKEITLRHLLTMSAGFNWVENSPISDGLWRSQNWVKYAIEMPMSGDPGEKFTYSTALTHLMSAMITKTSGMSTQDFARKFLFDPLGINVRFWRQDSQGIYFGGSELFLTPRDMAKFGYLYLKQGLWDGKRIVPSDWVGESVKSRVKTGGWGGFFDYGYWWWLQPNSYSAEGWGGQRIIVSPDQDLVVVFTAADFSQPAILYDNYIAPVVKTGKIKPNPKVSANLAALVKELEQPEAKPASQLPEIAGQISGKTYQLEKNTLGVNTFQLSFRNNNECKLTLETPDGKLESVVGLDGLYRFSNRESNVPLGFKGQWPGANLEAATFLLEWLYLGEPVQYEGGLTFSGDQVEIQVSIKPTGKNVIIKGKMID